MPSPTLQKVIEAIRSDKSTQRHEGLKNLREYFERDRVLRSIDEQGDGQAWVHIFQALFSAVLKEKEVCLKKGLDKATDAATKKLSSVSETLRWLTERACTRISYKCVKPLINHCLDIVVHRRKLLAPVAFPSLQVLRVILSHQPHREHIKGEVWLEMFSLSFAILIEDDISTYFTLDEDEEKEVEELALEDGMDIDSADHGEQEASEVGSGSPLKRRRKQSTPAQRSKPLKLPHARPRFAGLSREQICAAEIVHLLLASPNAVFKDESLPNLTRAILNKFRRFLEMFPQLTTAHHHIIHGIILTLTHAEMNFQADVVDFGRRTWGSFLSLWQKKDNIVKEGLVMIFTILLPFVTHTHLANIPLEQSEVRKLHNILMTEMEVCVQTKGLTLDNLRLEIADSPDESQPFQTRSLRSGLAFAAKQAHFWAVLQLEAECAIKLINPYWSPEPESGRAKRRKHENPLDSWISSFVSQHEQFQTRVARLQILLFFIEYHHEALDTDKTRSLVSDLVSAASSGNTDVQSWALLCLTALATFQGTEIRGEECPDWDSAWRLSLHLSTHPHTCRAACHLAYTLMTKKEVGLVEVQFLRDVENFIRDLAVRGPSYPFDSVCRFLRQCLNAAARDVRLFRLNLEEKVLWWLSDRWKTQPSSGPSNKSLDRVHFSPEDMLLLLSEIAACGPCPTIYSPQSPPEGFLPGIMVERARQNVILNYMLHAQLPCRPVQPDRSTQGLGSVGSSGADSSKQHSRQQIAAGAVSKLVESELDQLQTHEDLSKEFSSQRLQQTISLAVAALLFQAALNHNGFDSSTNLQDLIARLLTRLLPNIFLPQWSVSEQQSLIQGFLPLVTDRHTTTDFTWEAMLQPSAGTGIRHAVLQETRQQAVKNGKATRELLFTLWRMPKIFDCFSNRFQAFRKVLSDVMDGEPLSSINSYGASDSDLFGSFVVGSSGGEKAITFSNTASNIGIGLLRLLTRIPFFQASKPRRDESTFELIGTATGKPAALSIAMRSLVEEAQLGYIHIGGTFWKLAHELCQSSITKYPLSKNPDFQILATEFISTSMRYWLAPGVDEDALSSGLDYVEYFAHQYEGNKLKSWRTRVSVCRLLSQYLENDPREQYWKVQEEEEEEEGVEQRPSILLPKFSRDDDTRVRFTAATACASFVATSSDRKMDPVYCYGEIHRGLPRNILVAEEMLTRTLLLANMMIACSAVRRGSMWHLLEQVIMNQQYVRHVKLVFDHAVSRLGLAGVRDLFECYRYQIAYSIEQLGETLLSIPPQLIGFASDTDCARSTYRTMVPVLLVDSGHNSGREHQRISSFTQFCKKADRSSCDLFLECYPELVGRQLVYLVADFLEEHEALDVEAVFERATVYISKFAKMVGYPDPDSLDPGKSHDRILLSMLRMVSDIDHSDGASISKALQEFEGGTLSSEVFKHLNVFRNETEFAMHLPNSPASPARSILQSFRVLQKFIGELEDSMAVYHVIHMLFAEIDRSPMVNEQLRLVHSLCIWLAINAGRMSDATLLRTVIHGSLVLMQQVDLTRCAQSILSWSLALLGQQPLGGGFIRSTFIAIAHIASDLGTIVDDLRCAELSAGLFDWIETEASRLIEHTAVGEEVLDALCTWPRPLSEALSQAFKSRSKLTRLRSAIKLNQPFLEKHKLLRLVDDSLNPSKSSRQWTEQDLWRIKRSIPGSQQISYADALGLATVFSKCTEQSLSKADELQTISSRHQQIIRHAKINKTSKPFIIICLIEMLRSRAYREVNLAYRTLRSLLGEPCEGFEFSDLLDHRIEAEFLASYSLLQLNPPLQPLSKLEQIVASPTDYNQWIKETCCLLASNLALNDRFFGPLVHILEQDVSFSQQMLPILVHQSLSSENRDEARQILSTFFSRVLTDFTGARAAISSILTTVQYLRHFPALEEGSQNWLDIDYLLLARGAIASCAFTTALMFIELAVEMATSPQTEGSEEAEEMMYEIYGHIQEPDGFYGIHDKDTKSSLIRRYEHEQQWDKASQMLGAQFEVESLRPQAFDGIVKSLHFRGFHKQASLTLESAHPRTHHNSPASISYDLGWRTATWDLPLTEVTISSDFRLYTALRSLHCDRNLVAIGQVCQEALIREVGHLGRIADEDLFQIEKCIQRVICLKETNDWVNGPRRWTDPQGLDAEKLRNVSTLNSRMKFETFEKIMLTRLSLLRSFSRQGKGEQLGNIKTNFASTIAQVEHECLRELSSAARLSGDLQVALNSVVRAQALDGTPSVGVTQEFAKVLWQQNEQKFAVDLLHNLEGTLSKSNIKDALQRAQILAQIGEWSSEARLEKPTDIQERYFQGAINIICGAPSERDKAAKQVFESYALFAHRQYLSISASPELARLNLYMERKRNEIRLLEESIKSARSSRGKSFASEHDLQQHRNRAEKLLKEDASQAEGHNAARDMFLRQAIDMYCRSLCASNTLEDELSIRLCSLWYANFGECAYDNAIKEAISRIPSYKFLFLARQLVARLSDSDSQPQGSSGTLRNLILRICEEHPFHILPQIFALRQGSVKQERSMPKRSQSSISSDDMSQVGRQKAAVDIFNRLNKQPKSAQQARDVQLFCSASLEWATLRISKEDKGGPIPAHLSIRKLANLKIPVVTADFQIDQSSKYDRIVTITRYKANYTTAGGINVPKICECLGSDGNYYKQLFKGQGDDDLRQDAVMEQVFELMNTALARDRGTSRRNLHIRTYKVIPLSPQAGILEYVGNTIPLNKWLPSAHVKYRPKDISHVQGCKILKNARDEYNSNPKKDSKILVDAYIQVRRKFRPVMRHFFTEKFKGASDWFSTRLNYSRSVAVTSIAGHVLGLGDRHIGNILLDQSTGEVVHIDLGVAFEQGKLLTIPELVPFRLTGDMVDGFGISKTEGVFRRCAEQTLRVFRDNSEIILTVLDVFKYDPLHSWTINPIKKLRMQEEQQQQKVPITPISEAGTMISGFGGFGTGVQGTGIDLDSDPVDESCERALGSVARKLDKKLSIEYTVNEIVVAAMDDSNLGCIYLGWSPQY